MRCPLLNPDALLLRTRGGIYAQDVTLKGAVNQHGARNWKTIAHMLVNRTDVQCLHRWQKVLRPGLVKGPWSQEVGRRDVGIAARALICGAGGGIGLF